MRLFFVDAVIVFNVTSYILNNFIVIIACNISIRHFSKNAKFILFYYY